MQPEISSIPCGAVAHTAHLKNAAKYKSNKTPLTDIIYICEFVYLKLTEQNQMRINNNPYIS